MYYLYDLQTIKETISDYFDRFQDLNHKQATAYLIEIGYREEVVNLLSEDDYNDIKARLTL